MAQRICFITSDTVDGESLKAATSFQSTQSDEVFGSLKVSGPPKTLQEMDVGVLAEARRHMLLSDANVIVRST